MDKASVLPPTMRTTKLAPFPAARAEAPITANASVTRHAAYPRWLDGVGVVLIAFLARFLYFRANLLDFNGDSYHHWLIAREILANGGFLTDYKGMAAVWLPLLHYYDALWLLLSGYQTSLVPVDLGNIVLGVASCWLTYEIGYRLFQSRFAAVVAGLLMALSGWQIAISNANLPEVIMTVATLAAVLCLILERKWLFLAAVFLGCLTRYEFMFLITPVMLVALALRRRSWLVAAIVSWLGSIAFWSLLVWLQGFNPLHWWMAQAADAPGMSTSLSDWLNNSPVIFGQTVTLLQSTYPLLLLALAGIALYLARVPADGRRPWLLMIFGFLGIHILFVLADRLPWWTEVYVTIDLPWLALATAAFVVVVEQWRPRLSVLRDRARRVVVAAMPAASALAITILALNTLATQAPVFAAKQYSIVPEQQQGWALSHLAGSGRIWCDAPSSIYFSGMAPGRFVSSEMIGLYQPNNTALIQQLLHFNVTTICVENVAYTSLPQLVSQFRSGFYPRVNLGGGVTLVRRWQFTGWQTQYGAVPTAVYAVVH